MAASSVAAFWLVALLLIAVPGADWAFVLGSGLRGRTAVPAVGGIVLGYAAITAAVAAGVGGVVARTPSALTWLTVAGGLYLMWHGSRTLARAAAPAPPGRPPPARVPSGRTPPARVPSAGAPSAGAPAVGGRSVLAKGVGVSALNPKGLLVLFALLPQFASPRGSWPLTAQLGLLGLVFVVSCGAFYLCLAAVARRALSARPAAARAVTRFSGAAMILIGALLLAERFIH